MFEQTPTLPNSPLVNQGVGIVDIHVYLWYGPMRSEHSNSTSGLFWTFTCR